MNICQVSDLHIDIVHPCLRPCDFGFYDKLKEIDLLIIGGDISGSYKDTRRFINLLQHHIIKNELNTKVVFTMGNHEPYACATENTNIDEIRLKFSQEFDRFPVMFLYNDFVDINGVLVFGAPLYTNFCLTNNPKYSKSMADKYVNDFRHVKYINSNDELKTIKPNDYIQRFNTTTIVLDALCDKYPDNKIIIATHFAPSSKSIGLKYVGSELNSFYASDLEYFIEKHSNIILWTHGHVHDNFSYKVHQCQVECAPYGYYKYEHEVLPSEYSGKILTI